jgi:hypothetical protein
MKKSTENFKKVISDKLKEMAAKDPLFAECLNKENKNIDDCITYILNQVKNSGCSGFTDDEIFGMAAHYYDENSIEVGGPIDMDVVINHKVELTADDIQAAKQEALNKIIAEEKNRLKSKSLQKKPVAPIVEQPSLF